MRYVRAWPVMLALLGSAPAAQAQLIPFPAPYVSSGYSVGFSTRGRHTRIAAYVSGGSGYYTASGFGYPYYPGSASRLTIVQVYNPPPLVIGAPPVGLPDQRPRPRAEEVEPPDEKPLPGAVAGGFRPVRPQDRAQARQPVPAAPKQPEAPKEKPKEAAPEMPRPPQPEADPKAESARLTVLGKDAFAAGEYGRAAQRFRQATRVDPTNARAQFLLAQAEVALGKYDQAVEAIQAGLQLEPAWPMAKFRPVMLYDGNVADWPAHLQRLEDALTRHPDDPVLLFLNAYELWFDGRQDEARALFQRAAAVAPDKSLSERFLLARPDKPAI